MFIRSLTLATLLVAAGPLLAADSDSPLNQDLGKARPLIVIASGPKDPTLVSLENALKESENKKGFTDRQMVLYTVINTIGFREGKALDAQATMALIRELKLGASTGTKVILLGKDGEKKIDQLGPIGVKDLFTTIDQLPAEEKAAVAPAVAAPVPEAKPGGEKTGKPAKGAAAPKTLDD